MSGNFKSRSWEIKIRRHEVFVSVNIKKKKKEMDVNSAVTMEFFKNVEFFF